MRSILFSNPRLSREDPFDANTPAPLARFLRGHEVVRADELSWEGLDNDALLDAAEQAGRRLALVILSSNHWPTLRPRAARIATAIDFAQAGQIVTVDVAAV